MSTFSNYRLIPQVNGSCQLILYLDFKNEIAKLPLEKIVEHADQIQKQAERYITQYLPGVSIGTVQIMLGTILITSFLMTYPGAVSEAEFTGSSPVMPPSAAEPSKHPTSSIPNQPSSPQAVNPPPGQNIPPDTKINKPSIPPAVVPPNLGTRLVLVNKKYSLSPEYVPANLTVPQVHFTFNENLPQRYLQAEAAAALENLFNQAEQEGVTLYAVSGYRSYQRQAEIFARNMSKSPDANRFSARAGQSEHQTGLAMDVINSMSEDLSQSFGTTQEGRWLRANAARFGFIIRYLEDKEAITGYAYEPWHIRYVGLKAAQVIMDNGLTLEEYLGL